jgi:hypothetical protein
MSLHGMLRDSFTCASVVGNVATRLSKDIREMSHFAEEYEIR